jgi:2-oxoglutarate ferredoxin oxidoreductase subunit alpha
VLVLGWGSTYGPIGAACRISRAKGVDVAQAHLRHLNPFPGNTAAVLRSYDKVLIPEMNLGQLAMLIRAKFLVDAIGYNQVRGMPFRADELATALEEVVRSDRAH